MLKLFGFDRVISAQPRWDLVRVICQLAGSKSQAKSTFGVLTVAQTLVTVVLQKLLLASFLAVFVC